MNIKNKNVIFQYIAGKSYVNIPNNIINYNIIYIYIYRVLYILYIYIIYSILYRNL